MVLSGRRDQDIKFEAFDKDIDSDDFLGRCVACKGLIDYTKQKQTKTKKTYSNRVIALFHNMHLCLLNHQTSMYFGRILCDIPTESGA